MSAALLSLPRKLFLIWCHRKWTEMSGGLFASHGLNRFLFLPRLVSCSLTLTSSSPSFLSLSHTSQFHSVSPIYCVLLLALPVSFFLRCFFFPFLLLGLLLLPHSHYPTLFCSHFIFHLNTFSLYHSHTHASPPQSNQSGSSPPPPPPTYHRVYCICHHVLLA